MKKAGEIIYLGKRGQIFLGLYSVVLLGVVENYQAKVKVDTTASWGKDDIIKKLLELEKRLEKLEGL